MNAEILLTIIGISLPIMIALVKIAYDYGIMKNSIQHLSQKLEDFMLRHDHSDNKLEAELDRIKDRVTTIETKLQINDERNKK